MTRLGLCSASRINHWQDTATRTSEYTASGSATLSESHTQTHKCKRNLTRKVTQPFWTLYHGIATDAKGFKFPEKKLRVYVARLSSTGVTVRDVELEATLRMIA